MVLVPLTFVIIMIPVLNRIQRCYIYVGHPFEAFLQWYTPNYHSGYYGFFRGYFLVPLMNIILGILIKIATVVPPLI